MKKRYIVTSVVAAVLSIGSVSFAGNIETPERYSAPLEQNLVDMDVSAVKTGQEFVALSELELGEKSLGSNAEIEDLGGRIVVLWGALDICWGGDCPQQQ